MMKTFWATLSVLIFSSVSSADPLGHSLLKRYIDVDEWLSRQNIQVQSCSLYNKGKVQRDSKFGVCLYNYWKLHIEGREEDARVFINARFAFQPPSSPNASLEFHWDQTQDEKRSLLLDLVQYGAYAFLGPNAGDSIAAGRRMHRSLRQMEFNLIPARPVPLDYLFDEEKVIYFTTGLLLENGVENVNPSVDKIRISNEAQETKPLKGDFKDKINIRVAVGNRSEIQSEMIVDYSLNLRGIKLNELSGEVQLRPIMLEGAAD